MTKLSEELRESADEAPVGFMLTRWAAQAESMERALESIAANTCCDKCREAALIAAAALMAAGIPA